MHWNERHNQHLREQNSKLESILTTMRRTLELIWENPGIDRRTNPREWPHPELNVEAADSFIRAEYGLDNWGRKVS